MQQQNWQSLSQKPTGENPLHSKKLESQEPEDTIPLTNKAVWGRVQIESGVNQRKRLSALSCRPQTVATSTTSVCRISLQYHSPTPTPLHQPIQLLSHGWPRSGFCGSCSAQTSWLSKGSKSGIHVWWAATVKAGQTHFSRFLKLCDLGQSLCHPFKGKEAIRTN